MLCIFLLFFITLVIDNGHTERYDLVVKENDRLKMENEDMKNKLLNHNKYIERLSDAIKIKF